MAVYIRCSRGGLKSTLEITFDSEAFKGLPYTVVGGDETINGIVPDSLKDTVHIHNLNTLYKVTCEVDGDAYGGEVTTTAYYGLYTAEVNFWRATLSVTVTDKGAGVSGAKVTAVSSDKSYGPYTTDDTGAVTINIGKAGTYTVKATNASGEETPSQTVNVTTAGETYTVNCTYKTAPEFTYTGRYAIVNDSNGTLAENEPNWKIRLLSSGTLNFSELGTGANGIDVFLVGGGGGATWSSNSTARVGSGGALVTQSDVKIETGKDYAITIGGGGSADDDHGYAGGASSAFSYTANGGTGDGGATSGGYEFGATTGSERYGYTVGGSGNVNGPANTGAGGRGHTNERKYAAYGGSGIVIIRNHRA